MIKDANAIQYRSKQLLPLNFLKLFILKCLYIKIYNEIYIIEKQVRVTYMKFIASIFMIN